MEIFQNTLDLKMNIGEIALDSITKDGILKEIPIVQTLVSFYNISTSLMAGHTLKKILILLQEFNTQKVDPDKLEKFKIGFQGKS